MTESKLFTPGPLSTSEKVKKSMLVDLGSRDARFVANVRRIRSDLLRVGGRQSKTYFSSNFGYFSVCFEVVTLQNTQLSPCREVVPSLLSRF